MLTIDASVWVNADSPTEPGSAVSAEFLKRIAAANTQVFVPTLLRVEVAAAIARGTKDSEVALAFAEKLSNLPFLRWIALDDALAARAALLAANHGLRGADAVYAAVAITHGCQLVSLDREHLIRLAPLMNVVVPL